MVLEEFVVENKILVAIAFLYCFTYSVAFAELKVFYIPIATETYIPITSENIEQQAQYIFTTKDIKFKDAVSQIQNSKVVKGINKITDVLNMRIKIIDLHSKKTLFVDNFYKTYDEKNMLASDEIIKNTAGQVDKIVQYRCLKNKKEKFIKPSSCSK